MISDERRAELKRQTDLLTLTGPGTPGGNLLRSYWQPIILTREFPAWVCSVLTARTGARTSATVELKTAGCGAFITAGYSTSTATVWTSRLSRAADGGANTTNTFHTRALSAATQFGLTWARPSRRCSPVTRLSAGPTPIGTQPVGGRIAIICRGTKAI